MLTFEISSYNHCRRLESFLRNLLPGAASGYPRKLIKSGAAKRNGEPATADTLLFSGDSVTLKESAAVIAALDEMPAALDILYENDGVVLVNKPSGLPMHRTGMHEKNLVEIGMSFMIRRSTPCKLYPVNRLDRGTSGVVILAKSSTSAGIYGRQVKETGLVKQYLALVEGTPDGEMVISEPLDGKESETRFKVLRAVPGCSLLSVTPISGRMHQIRRHLEMIGHPVLGDRRYGSGELPGMTGFALHSFRTSLRLPETDGQLSINAPMPEALLGLCVQCGIGEGDVLAVLREEALK